MFGASKYRTWLRHPGANFGGGDSGGSENSATEAQGRMLDYNLGKLKETDALRDPYMAGGLQGAMGAYDKYSSQGYIDQMKGAAANAAQAATDSKTAEMVRTLGRYGLNPNSGKFAGMANRNAMAGAATKAGAVNQTGIALDTAQTTAATNKWKLLNDMQTESMTQGQQIAGGYGSQGQTMAQNAQTNAQANAGLGSTLMAGADIYEKYFKKDGGLVEEGFADGGRARYMERGMSMTGPNAGIQAAPQPSGAQQAVGIAKGVNRVYKLVNPAKAEIAKDASIDVANTALADASADGTTALGLTGTGAGVGGVGSQAAGAGLAEAAGEAAAETTASLATGVETAAAANAWNPIGWALGAAALFGALSHKDGGIVHKPGPLKLSKRRAMFEKTFEGEKYTGTKAQDQQMLAYLQGILHGAYVASKRHDLRDGGGVDGPGSKTSDSIPARLSDGEFVVNAESVAIPGVRAQLERINHAGLMKRYSDGYADGGFVDWIYHRIAANPKADSEVDKRKFIREKLIDDGVVGKAAGFLRNRDAQIEAELKRQGLKNGGMVKRKGC